MKKVAVIGHFGFGHEYLDGQTVKTIIITEELCHHFGNNAVLKIDTHGRIKTIFKAPFQIFKALKNSKNIIILPAYNGLRVFVPILQIQNRLFHRKLHYCVIGGWLSDMLKTKKKLAKQLKKFDGIYVETNTMKMALEEQGFTNVVVMPNCKDLHILDENELVYSTKEPFKLCTFSRVMKEKGIDDAIEAVKKVNEVNGRVVYTLDIYGQVDSSQSEWFDDLQKAFPEYVKYSGVVPFNKSVEVLKDYYALLFPTYYEGEGFAGTLLDAMAAGIPVIASDWKYNSEIVNGENGLLFETHNVDDLIVKMDRLSKFNTIARKIDIIKESEKYQPSEVLKILIEKLK